MTMDANDPLIAYMYQPARGQTASHRFGLSNGQCLADELVHNGRWFNRRGEYLGWGDLDEQSIRAIRDGLTGDEMFLVMTEYDFCIYINDRVGTYRWESLDAATRRRYVYDYAHYLFVPGKIYDILDFGSGQVRTTRGGTSVERINRGEFRRLIAQ